MLNRITNCIAKSRGFGRFSMRYWVSCLVLHPVSYPNKGPLVEQYMAEEAIGLAKSLGWTIIEGPYWGGQMEQTVQADKQPILEEYILNESTKQKIMGRPPTDGEYVYSKSFGGGTYYKGGLIFNMDESSSDGDLYNQWKNKLLRSSLANRSLVKTRKITQKLYFTRGKAEVIGDYIRQKAITCVFINTELTPGQIRNLKKLFEAKLNNTKPPKGFNQQTNQSQTQFESDTQNQSKSTDKSNPPAADKITIKIFDRFSIILQIFAKRAKTPTAKLQIELNFLNYLKTRLVRAEGSTYSASHNLFRGDLTKAQQINLEIVSARQRKAHAAMSGSGESQLEIERRLIRDKQARIRKELGELQKMNQRNQSKQKFAESGIPIVALVGYTNAGKSATMNCLLKKNVVQSEDLLFQTLSTTARQIVLPSGTKARLLDTIGFISKLPHELVDSFKTTLLQIQNATIVLHIIDTSHPYYELQKRTVLKVLKDLNFPESFYSQRMIEVHNKVDLLTPQQKLLRKKTQSNNVFYVSATKATGIKKLMAAVQELANKLLNKGVYTFRYSIPLHFKRLQWLRQHINIPNNLNEVYDYTPSEDYPEGWVQYKLTLDAASYGKITKQFDEVPTSRKTAKGMPPPGWASQK